jgi:hypothetical protein
VGVDGGGGGHRRVAAEGSHDASKKVVEGKVAITTVCIMARARVSFRRGFKNKKQNKEKEEREKILSGQEQKKAKEEVRLGGRKQRYRNKTRRSSCSEKEGELKRNQDSSTAPPNRSLGEFDQAMSTRVAIAC